MSEAQFIFDKDLAAAFRNFYFQAMEDGRHKEIIEVCFRVANNCPDDTAFTEVVIQLWSTGIKTLRHSRKGDLAKDLVSVAYAFREPIAPSKMFKMAVEDKMKKMHLTPEIIAASKPPMPAWYHGKTPRRSDLDLADDRNT